MNRGRHGEKIIETHIEKYSPVSSIIERVKNEMKSDIVLRKRVEDLPEKIIKSQRQTCPKQTIAESGR
jgi:hypothetical protein